MSGFLDRFGDQLLVAGEQLTVEPRRRRRGAAVWVMAAAVLMTGTALAATGPWQPEIGRPGEGGPVGTSSSPVPKEQTALLAVLRRPQTDADRRSLELRQLKNVSTGLHGVRLSSIRVLTASTGEQAVLVSVQRAEVTGRNLLCVLRENTVACTTTDGFATGKSFVSGQGRAFGIVPDGIKRIEVDYPRGPKLATDVRDNFWFLPRTTPGLRPSYVKLIR